MPVAFIDATAVSEVLHTPPKTVSVNIKDDPSHIVVVPAIDPVTGKSFEYQLDGITATLRAPTPADRSG